MGTPAYVSQQSPHIISRSACYLAGLDNAFYRPNSQLDLRFFVTVACVVLLCSDSDSVLRDHLTGYHHEWHPPTVPAVQEVPRAHGYRDAGYQGSGLSPGRASGCSVLLLKKAAKHWCEYPLYNCEGKIQKSIFRCLCCTRPAVHGHILILCGGQ